MSLIQVRRLHWPVFRVIVYGIFDSNIRYPHQTRTDDRTTEQKLYELEFFSDECQGKAVINGTEHSIQRGTFICAKPGRVRSSIFPLRCNYMHLVTEDPELVAFLNTIPDVGILPHPSEAEELFRPLLALDDPTLLSSRLTIYSSACRLMELFDRAGRFSLRYSAHIETMLAAEEYIQNHLSENLSLETVARAVSLSACYFHRLFTDFFGKTPAQYILDCRIATAKLELLKENCSISTLAADCGFSSHSYFSQKFKQATGKSPLQYRKEMLSQIEL